MKFVFVFIFSLCSLFSFSQSWQWVDHITGGPATHLYYGIELSNDGTSVYAVGRYRSTATFYGQDTNIVDPYHAGSRDAFITKIDSAGNYQWLNTEGGPDTDYGFDVTTDEFDNVYMVGITSDTAYFGTQQITSNPGYASAYIAKYSADGNLIWVKNWKSSGTVWGTKIECDKKGHIYITGHQAGNFNYDSGIITDKGFFIGKLDYSGNFIWCKGPNNLNASSFSRGEALFYHKGHIYIGGSYSKGVSFDTISHVTGTSPNIFFAKLDSLGSFKWVRQVSGDYYSGCRDISVTDSSLYIVGYYTDTANFDTISVYSNQTGSTTTDALNSRDGFIAKYNVDGSSCYWVKEQKSLYNDYTYSVNINKLGNIITSGTYAYDSGTNSADWRITEYSPNGSVNWEHVPTGNYIGSGICFAIDKDNNYYAGGGVRGNYSFSPNINLTAYQLATSAVIGRLYPPITLADSNVSVCNEDSIWFALPNINGSPLSYEWYINDQQMTNNNDSLLTNASLLDSIWCVVSNNEFTDTSYFYITDNSFNFSLGPDTTTCIDNNSINLTGPETYSNYTWSNGDNTQNTVVTQSGIYTLEVINDFGCSYTDSIEVSFVDCTDIQHYLSGNINLIRVAPNTFKIETEEKQFNVNIYNINGELYSSLSNKSLVDMSTAPKGIYVLHYLGGKSFSHKLLIR